jgi:cell division protease FtsH
MAANDVKFPKPKKSAKPPVRGAKPGGNNDEGDTNWRGMAYFLLCLSFLALAFYMMQHQSPPMVEKNKAELDKLIQEKKIVDSSLTYVYEPATGTSFLRGKYNMPGTDGKTTVGQFKTYVNLDFDRDLKQYLAANGLNNVNTEVVTNTWGPILINLLPLLFLVGIVYFFFRQQLRMAGKNAFSFGKSKAKMMSRDKNKVTFKDVAGVDEAREEVSEIVEFLKDPRRFQKLGGRIPKGVLMVGPPGTGKTLIAKAIAGEADVPFFSISGSDFVEMFVGVGASRVRDMFEQGKKHAPCLIFIDEIDAVGRSRGTGMGGGHDEREQTLNALLVEMDGIDSTEGIIMIAATNRKDVLDPALLRPGRFDREVRVTLPDVKGREQILKVHVRNVKLNPAVDLSLIARGTPGYSGAELANVINEAALLAAKYNQEDITQKDFEEARDKVRWGRERRSMAMTEEEKKATAYHEAGHALLNVLLVNTDRLHKVSIIPRGPALGVTMSLPEQDRLSYWKKWALDRIIITMGGRVAEELFLGDVCSGASGDIHQATSLARAMVCEWGMSEKLGMVQYAQDSSMTFLGRDLGQSRTYSEKTAQDIDQEVHRLVSESYNKARELIVSHREQVEAITMALLEFETLEGQQVADLIKHGKMLTPPNKPMDPPTLPNPQEILPATPEKKKKEKDDGMLPGLQGAPAGA